MINYSNPCICKPLETNMTTIQKYAHDYREMAMTEEELKDMLRSFLSEILPEEFSARELDYDEDTYNHGFNACIDAIKEKCVDKIAKRGIAPSTIKRRSTMSEAITALSAMTRNITRRKKKLERQRLKIN